MKVRVFVRILAILLVLFTLTSTAVAAENNHSAPQPSSRIEETEDSQASNPNSPTEKLVSPVKIVATVTNVASGDSWVWSLEKQPITIDQELLVEIRYSNISDSDLEGLKITTTRRKYELRASAGEMCMIGGQLILPEEVLRGDSVWFQAQRCLMIEPVLGSALIYTEAEPNGVKLPDDIFLDRGAKLPTLAPGEEMRVTYRAKTVSTVVDDTMILLAGIRSAIAFRTTKAKVHMTPQVIGWTERLDSLDPSDAFSSQNDSQNHERYAKKLRYATYSTIASSVGFICFAVLFVLERRSYKQLERRLEQQLGQLFE